MAYLSNNITVDGARLIFRNFSGKETKFNAKGVRNFGWLIEDHDMAEQLAADGWNIKYLRPRDEYEEPAPWLKVSVSFDKIAPRIYLVSSKSKTLLDEEDVGLLDWANLKHVDLIIRPYNYSVSGREGVKAYLKTMYAVLDEDDFDAKYQDVPDSAKSAVMNKNGNMS